MTNITIRHAVQTDAEQIVRLHLRTRRSAFQNIISEEDILNREKNEEERIEKWHPYGDIYLVALDGEKIVGFANALMKSDYEYYAEKCYADLQGIYVDEEYQNRGIGKAFFDQIIKFLTENGATKMVIGTLKGSKACFAYEKWGGTLDTSYTKLYMDKYPQAFYLYNIHPPRA